MLKSALPGMQVNYFAEQLDVVSPVIRAAPKLVVQELKPESDACRSSVSTEPVWEGAGQAKVPGQLLLSGLTWGPQNVLR